MSKAPDFLAMSDDEFEKQPVPVAETKSVDGGEDNTSQSTTSETGTTTEEVGSGKDNTGSEGQETETTSTETTTEEGKNSQTNTEDEGETSTTDSAADADKDKDKASTATTDKTTPTTKASEPGKEGDKSEGTQKTGETTQTEAKAPDYEGFYKQIMTPFKANGRTVELKTPEEAIQLMQMGANYTKKMQELVPHRKVLTMLQNNGLLDEDKLSFLIDVEKKDPEAIKKLIQDAGIDPMEIDTSSEAAYQDGNHRVSDEEVAFHSALDDMKSSPDRVGTLKVINDEWDQVSKEALWKNPEVMGLIHVQRENGVYDRINAEVNRRRTLGSIPVNVPFLQAYKVVGDELTAANAFADLKLSTPSTTATSPSGSKDEKVITTRVAAPKPAVTNSDRAAAASTSRQTTTKSKGPLINPLAMSDEDFLKQFDGRL